MNWNPYSVEELVATLKGTDTWFLDGGHSIDFLLGGKLRDHGDIDIGVFSVNAKEFLDNLLDLGFKVYAAEDNLAIYKKSCFDASSYNYWVSDESGYRFQVLIYKLDSGQVSFRRNPGVTWPENTFLISKEKVKVVNPLVTYAFKVTASTVQEKDLFDISRLSNWVAENA